MPNEANEAVKAISESAIKVVKKPKDNIPYVIAGLVAAFGLVATGYFIATKSQLSPWYQPTEQKAASAEEDISPN